MKVLDLFSGIGGFSLGLERAGMETVAFCEIEDYPVSILNKHWPDVPVHRDIRKLDGRQYYNKIDLLCGGFPCQPFSVAGIQKGKEDDRHLWPEMLRIIKESRPAWVIGENVIGFIKMALDDVLLDLESEGYTSQSFVIPACAVGGIHRRSRVFIISYAEHNGLFTTQIGKGKQQTIPRSSERPNSAIKSERICLAQNVAYSHNKGLEGFTGNEQEKGKRSNKAGSTGSAGFPRDWESIREPTQSAICYRDNGLSSGLAGSNRVNKLKALGNAVVPQIPEMIGRAIMEVANEI